MERSSEPRRLTLTVPPDLDGRKVDTLLRRTLGLSGTVVRRAKCLEDGITLDGVRVFSSAVARQGQVLSVQVGDLARRGGIPSVVGPLNIVYEDEDMVVVNKAPGIPAHPGPGHWDDTLGNHLLAHYDANGERCTDFHPVHRLDKGTSGLMVVAKHAHAQEMLKRQLHTPAFRRIYLAVCLGTPSPAQGVVEAPIGRVDGSLIARQVRPDGQEARTRYRVLSCYGGLSLLRLELDTGRTHQIRVHMAHLGHPLAGDFLYGSEGGPISRPALHSAELFLLHPITGEPLHFVLPLPDDMAGLVPLYSNRPDWQGFVAE